MKITKFLWTEEAPSDLYKSTKKVSQYTGYREEETKLMGVEEANLSMRYSISWENIYWISTLENLSNHSQETSDDGTLGGIL